MGIVGKIAAAYMKRGGRPFCSAVVVAAGASERMGGDNKMFAKLLGVPVLVRTLRALGESEYIDEIVVVAREEDLEAVADLCGKYGVKKISKVVCGGPERLDSALIGVYEASPKAKLIAVHDGARPLVTREIIDEAVKRAAAVPAVAPAVPVQDTVKRAKGGIVSETLDRAELFAVQTPQVFQAVVLKGALQNAKEKGLKITDDCMAAEAMGVAVRLTHGSFENIKITTPTDLVLAGAILEARAKQ